MQYILVVLIVLSATAGLSCIGISFGLLILSFRIKNNYEFPDGNNAVITKEHWEAHKMGDRRALKRVAINGIIAISLMSISTVFFKATHLLIMLLPPTTS
jgi:hypothetical protein